MSFPGLMEILVVGILGLAIAAIAYVIASALNRRKTLRDE